MQRIYSKTSRLKNPEAHRKLVSSKRKKTREWYQELKKTLKCEDCGENDPRCLDFNHVGKKTKDVSVLVANGCSKETILKEIKECTVKCANCHRKSHNGNR